MYSLIKSCWLILGRLREKIKVWFWCFVFGTYRLEDAAKDVQCTTNTEATSS
ncbi:hypothetical protein BVRB_9g216700 isoform A [Beta vulgaris subsp. vulgaris]|nr:hypothetical protein BVRB_9g216700 isoform A [Beta vulgaris subsp. vulgaris]